MRIFVDGEEVSRLPRLNSWMEKYKRICRLLKRYRHDGRMNWFYTRAYHELMKY